MKEIGKVKIAPKCLCDGDDGDGGGDDYGDVGLYLNLMNSSLHLWYSSLQ